MARQFIYHMQGLTKAYSGGKKVLENINLSFYPDAKIGVLGPNGSGKSTLLKIMAGIEKEFAGEAWLAEGATVGYLSQEPELDPDEGRARQRHGGRRGEEGDPRPLQRADDELFRRDGGRGDQAPGPDRQQESVGPRRRRSRWRWTRSAVRRAMPTSPCSPAARSGGWRCASFSSSAPDLLLLDEPTNHLDAETTAWLEKHLREFPGSVLIVTHDRYFLDNVTGWILELDRGRGIPYEGNYSAYLDKKAKRLEQEGREEAARQRALAREREWIAASPRARQAKSKARIRAYDELLKRNEERAPGTSQIIIPPGERLGQTVIEIEHLSKGYGDRLLIDDLSFKLPPGGIVGVIGAERRRQDDALPHDHRRGEARRRHDRTRRDRASRLCRPEPRRPRARQDGVGGDLRRPGHHQASASAR